MLLISAYKIRIRMSIDFGPEDPSIILKPGQTGEICAKGPQICMGYLDNPTASAETFKDGWFHTGDVGHIDEEGLFHIEDRIKE